MPFASLSMIGGADGTGCDGVRSPVHNGWNSRDVRMTSVCDCVKESVSCIM